MRLGKLYCFQKNNKKLTTQLFQIKNKNNHHRTEKSVEKGHTDCNINEYLKGQKSKTEIISLLLLQVLIFKDPSEPEVHLHNWFWAWRGQEVL